MAYKRSHGRRPKRTPARDLKYKVKQEKEKCFQEEARELAQAFEAIAHHGWSSKLPTEKDHAP